MITTTMRNKQDHIVFYKSLRTSIISNHFVILQSNLQNAIVQPAVYVIRNIVLNDSNAVYACVDQSLIKF